MGYLVNEVRTPDTVSMGWKNWCEVGQTTIPNSTLAPPQHIPTMPQMLPLLYTLPRGVEVVFASPEHQKSFILPLLRYVLVLCYQLDFPKIVNPQGSNLSKGAMADSTLYPPQDPLIEHSKYSTSIHSMNEKVAQSMSHLIMHLEWHSILKKVVLIS